MSKYKLEAVVSGSSVESKLHWPDLKPTECFIWKKPSSDGVMMRTKKGYIWLDSGGSIDEGHSGQARDPIIRAVPRNPFEFDLEE